MATSQRQKPPCSKCGKAGILTCHGCQNGFCYIHVAQHRHELNQQMEEIITNRDQLQQTIAEHREKPKSHPLMTQIDQWEQQSIDKIRTAATNSRKELLGVIDRHTTRVSNELVHVTEEVNKARNDDDYVETDLKVWVDQLKKLKEDLTAPNAISFGQSDNDTALVSDIFINSALNECFDQVLGEVQIIEHGRLAVHGQAKGTGAVVCQGKYASGQHRIRFQFEQTGGQPIYIGIISGNTPLQSILNDQTFNPRIRGNKMVSGNFFVNYQTPTAFSYLNTNNYGIRADQIFEFVIDCNRKTISFASERSSAAVENGQKVNACPFPWQCFISFYYPGTRLRLC